MFDETILRTVLAGHVGIGVTILMLLFPFDLSLGWYHAFAMVFVRGPFVLLAWPVFLGLIIFDCLRGKR